MSGTPACFQKQHTFTFSINYIPSSNLPRMLVSSLTSVCMPGGENTMVNSHEDRWNLYPHFQTMEISILKGSWGVSFDLEELCGGGADKAGICESENDVTSISPSCVYFITCSRLGKQTSPESERNNQNQNQIITFIQFPSPDHNLHRTTALIIIIIP